MMRNLSCRPHRPLIGFGHDIVVQLVKIPRASLALLIAAVLVCGVVLGGVWSSLRGADPTPGPVAASSTPSFTPSPSVGVADVAGEDLERLPRYPGTVRSGYEMVREDRFRLIATEYHVKATVDEVRTFYQGVIAEHGWERADINFDHGEWSYVLVDGSIEALIEIEEFGGLVEIDLQISEPIESHTPTPAAPTPTSAPTSAPNVPPPPPPPPPGDDDDGDDDDDSDDGDDGSEDD